MRRNPVLADHSHLQIRDEARRGPPRKDDFVPDRAFFRNEFSSLALLNGFQPEIFMRSALLWLIGVPIPLIIILWLITGHA
jgi:hypothetical protein